jgi:hypothetical protein
MKGNSLNRGLMKDAPKFKSKKAGLNSVVT